MKKRFSIIKKPYYLFYAFSLSGLVVAWRIPFFGDFSRSFWIVTAPLIVGVYLQLAFKDNSDSSYRTKKPIGIYIILGILFASVIISIIAILFLIGVL